MSRHNHHHHHHEFIMDDEHNDYRDLQESISSDFDFNHIALKDKSSLLKLPTEILLQIFNLIDRKDLFSLLTVCKIFANLIIEILWFRPNMQNDTSFKKIKQIMELPRRSTYWDYRNFIKRLNLSFMTKLVDDNLLNLFFGCPKLERLTLVNCTQLTHVPISKVLLNCQRLQSIDLTGVANIHDDIINALANNCQRLQGLYAPGCGEVSESAIINLLQSCPMLKRVKFNNSLNITDTAIKTLYENCKSLVEIDLHNCPNVSDQYLKQIFLELSQLREFRISNAPGITDKLFELLPPDFFLEKLRIIDITGCNAITDKLVEKLVLCAPRLRNVVLSKCMQISDVSLRALSQLGRSLHYIHLGHCSYITDFGVASLVRSCHRIQYIDLACCSQLTDGTLIELASLPKLRRIGLVKCNQITDTGILELVSRRGEHDCLERVHLSYCTNLTIVPIFYLLKSCPKLTHLSLTGISAFLRSEITQYCRDPPADFTEQQKSSFCVFSGHGVSQLRNYLMRTMEDRTYSVDANLMPNMQELFQERRRLFLNQGRDLDDDEMNIWANRGLGLFGNNPNNANANANNNNANGNNRNDVDVLMNNNNIEMHQALFRDHIRPEDMRDHYQRLVRQHHQNRLQERNNNMNNNNGNPLDNANLNGNPPPIIFNLDDNNPDLNQPFRIEVMREGEEPRLPPNVNFHYAPQIRQPAVFPNGDDAIPIMNDDEDVDMEGGLFPRR